MKPAGVVAAVVFALGVLLTQSCTINTNGYDQPNTRVGGHSSPTPNSEKSSRDKQIRTVSSGSKTIVPGEKIGDLALGISQEKAISFLGSPIEQHAYDGYAACDYSEMHWMTHNSKNRGIYAYFENDRIFQIESFSDEYAETHGISVEALPSKLRGFYPGLVTFRLVGSGADVDGGKELMYMVDQDLGIAFSIYYFKNYKSRRIGSIIVFDRNRTFQPNGCVSSPQKFVKEPS